MSSNTNTDTNTGKCQVIWEYDDISTCARHLYLEQNIPSYTLIISIIVLIIHTYYKSKPRSQQGIFEFESTRVRRSDSSSSEIEPWLDIDHSSYSSSDQTQHQHNQNENQNQNISSIKLRSSWISGKAISRQHFDLSLISPTKEDGSPMMYTALRQPDWSSKIRVIIEEFLLIFQVFLQFLTLTDSNLESNFANFLLWSFLLLICTYRLVSFQSLTNSRLPQLWMYSTVIYISQWIVNLILIRSTFFLDHINNNTQKWYYIWQFILVSCLFCLNCSSNYSDQPILVNKDSINSREAPESSASIFQQITYTYINDLLHKAYNSPIEQRDIWSLVSKDTAYYILNKFHTDKSKLKFTLKLFSQFKVLFMIQTVLTIIEAVFDFAPPLLLKKVLEYISDTNSMSKSMAWTYATGIFVTSMISSIASGKSLFIGRKICSRIRGIIIGEIYAKALRRRITAADDSKDDTDKTDRQSRGDTFQSKASSSSSSSQFSSSKTKNSGEIISLMAVDSIKISESCGFLHYFVNSCIMAFLSISMLYDLLGWAAFVGALSIIALLPATRRIYDSLNFHQRNALKYTDKRIQKLNEVFQNIRIIKFFAWETKVTESVNEIRELELYHIWRRALWWISSGMIWFGTPALVSGISFFCYTVIQGNLLTTPVAFSALALFNLLKLPLIFLSDMTSYANQAMVSFARVEEFLNEPETSKYYQLVNSIPNTTGTGSSYVGFQNANFSWSNDGDNHSNHNLSSNGLYSNHIGRSANSSNNFQLKDIDVSFKLNKLNIIIGATGSGKTSMLLALLGEMELISGSVHLPGYQTRDELVADPVTGLTESVAYCAQSSWLLNATIRENILFANPFNKERYDQVVYDCGLLRDFEILDDGDLTEVGEKGITLSGGQKQRVSLARALYSSAAYVLLDDCLSAVDSHTASHIYEHCITGNLMKNRTCILASHNVALTIKQAEFIVVMDNGRVKAQGTPEELILKGQLGLIGNDNAVKSAIQSRSGSSINLSEFNVSSNMSMSDLKSPSFMFNKQKSIGLSTNQAQKKQLDYRRDEQEQAQLPRKKHTLVEQETISKGSVDKELYLAYFNYFGGLKLWFFIVVVFMFTQNFNVIETNWLRIWASENDLINDSILKSDETNHSAFYYVTVYFLIGIVYTLLSCFRLIFIFRTCLQSSKVVFGKLLQSVLNADLKFFDSTPVGRIMNRFSKDVESVDLQIPMYIENFIIGTVSCITIAIVISVVTPAFLIFAIFLSIAFYYIGTVYLSLSRDLKRYESITKSPLHQLFSETLSGIVTIRAYGDEHRFLRMVLERIDNNTKPYYYVWITNRWLSIRIFSLGSLICFLSFALALSYIGTIDTGMAGISLSYAMSFNQYAVYLVIAYSQLELGMNSVERIEEYLHIDQEPSAEIPYNDPPGNWPDQGRIQVKNLSLRYSNDLPCVIKNVSFDVEPALKIGIVGRTGAGKSTIITAFFRFMNYETGSIVIDGIDISTIGLKKLRSSITIIPQDPTLFEGTIRSNLDPYNEYSEKEILLALRRVSLITLEDYEHLINDTQDNTQNHRESNDNKNAILTTSSRSRSVTRASSPKLGSEEIMTEFESDENTNKFLNLDNPVYEGGSNLSQGQRQLVCLARSLLKSPKLIMLDEATASIDYLSDAKVQNVIREEFKGSTILTIAHRLKSIIDYDKILVLDAGEIKEYDSPYNLIMNEKSQFRSMCSDSGMFEELVKSAKEAYFKTK